MFSGRVAADARLNPRQKTPRKIYRNIVHLFIWQGSTYLVPLIVTPYLARVLGVQAFGKFGLTIAVVTYGMLLSDWGFTLSATQKVARASHDPVLLRRLFWGTLTAKFGLSLLALALLAVVTMCVPTLRAMWPALVAGSLGIIATAASVNWFLQGLQLMGKFAGSALAGRLMMIPLMILLVHVPDDLWKAVAVQGGTQFLSAIVSNVVAARTVRLAPFAFDPGFAWQQVRDGWHQFVSNLSTSFYTQVNGVFLGFLSTPAQLGLLMGSQRISSAFQGLVVPINLAIYPQINYMTEHDPPGAVRLMARVLTAQAVFAGCLGIAMYVAAPFIVPRFLGRDFTPAIPVVQVLALLPFLAGVTNVLGQDILLPLGLKAGYTASLVGAGLVNVLLLFVLVRPFGAIGSASASIVTEIALTVMMGRAIYRNRGVLARMRRGEKP